MIINCHTHLFTNNDVPNNFLPAHLVSLVSNKYVGGLFRFILKNLIPFTNKDILDRYARFIKVGNLGTQKKIFNDLKQNYPIDTLFVALSMDMSYMNSGKVNNNYKDQLIELSRVDNNVLPFICVDPRREKIFELVKEMIENYGYKGIKLYPSLGYLPTDARLIPIYRYCNEHNIPIITHCSPYNAVHYRNDDNYIRRILCEVYPYEKLAKLKTKELVMLLSHPRNYIQILESFPNLRIDLAHFGGDEFWNDYANNKKNIKDNWHNIIIQMMKTYPNLYTDISFSLYSEKLIPSLIEYLKEPQIGRKILFGTDFYMNETEITEEQFIDKLRNKMDTQLFDRLTYWNPKRFLNM